MDTVEAYRLRKANRIAERQREKQRTINAYRKRVDKRRNAIGLPPIHSFSKTTVQPSHEHLTYVGNSDSIKLDNYIANYPDDAVDWRTISGARVPFSLKTGEPLNQAGNDIQATSKTQDIDLSVKPTVRNAQLKRTVDEIYKGQRSSSPVGNGTLMDAVQHEIRTGRKTKGSNHLHEARHTISSLQNQIRSGKLNERERRIARALERSLRSSLNP